MEPITKFKTIQSDYGKVSDLSSSFDNFLWETDIDINDEDRETLEKAKLVLTELTDKVYNEGRKIGKQLIHA